MEGSNVVGLVVVAIITTVGGYLTARASSKAAQRSAERTVAGQIETSRIQAEQGAYQRAREFYEGVIDRQKTEITELEGDLHALKERLAEVEVQQEQARNDLARTRRELADTKTELDRCRRDCDACRTDLALTQQALRHAVHDDEEDEQ